MSGVILGFQLATAWSCSVSAVKPSRSEWARDMCVCLSLRRQGSHQSSHGDPPKRKHISLLLLYHEAEQEGGGEERPGERAAPRENPVTTSFSICGMQTLSDERHWPQSDPLKCSLVHTNSSHSTTTHSTVKHSTGRCRARRNSRPCSERWKKRV